MRFVVLTALGVGGATMLGAVLGFWLLPLVRRYDAAVLGFGGGVMLGSTVWGLIEPAVFYGGKYALFVTVLGVFTGAVTLMLLERRLPALPCEARETGAFRAKGGRALLLVPAIALHNLPEGLAAGVGFATDNMGEALFIAGGIALQNLPEGMVIIAPMLAAGVSRKKTLLLACLTGAVEVVGALIGYAAALSIGVLLPLSLSFAGGCMLFVICREVVPEMQAGEGKSAPVLAFLCGLCLMLVINELL
ncbi:MAG: ZIP family metal transporter [Ruminococcaceae bacterium]|nr:ZIP family metal transporter [Oscillospiraceae bacterium]